MLVAAPPSVREDLVERARRLRQLADELEAEAGTTVSGADSDAAQAIASALRGESVRARLLAARAENGAHGDVDSLALITLARAISWMSEGQCSVAFTALTGQVGSTMISPRVRAALCGPFAELAVRVHRVPEARQTLQPWFDDLRALPDEERREFDLAELLLGDADPVLRLERAVAESRSPFTAARMHLALGMALRRARQPMGSRAHLMIAVDLLTQQQALPWLTLARNELRAAGVREAGEIQGVALSAQERAIVELASQGLSNREIGERLYLSPRTVGSHLYRVFPKLGITSRHQLSKTA